MYTWPSTYLDIASIDYRDGKVIVELHTPYSDHKYFHMSKDLLDRAFKKTVENFELAGIKLVNHISAVRNEEDGHIILWEFAPKFEPYPDIMRYITEAYVKHCANDVLPTLWKEDIQNAELNEEAARRAFYKSLEKTKNGRILLVKEEYFDIGLELDVTPAAAERLSEYYCSHEEFWDAVIDFFKGHHVEKVFCWDKDRQDAYVDSTAYSGYIYRPVAEKIAQSHGLELEIS